MQIPMPSTSTSTSMQSSPSPSFNSTRRSSPNGNTPSLNSSSTTTTTTIPSTQAPMQSSTFKPPAHIHSHHLHTIPPRDKSTSSLILDQTLALNTTIRLAAVRAEIGWGVSGSGTGPSTSSAGGLSLVEEVEHRHEFHTGFVVEDVPEHDDFQELGYNDPSNITGRSRSNGDCVQLRVPNTTLSTALHAKAQGNSNVLCAILSQHHHHHHHPTTIKLPNGVRFRLALAILTDQFFAPLLQNGSVDRDESEIPLDVAPFVSLSSYRPTISAVSSTAQPPTLPGIKTLMSSASSPTSPPAFGNSPFASFSASSINRSKPFFASSAAPQSSTPPPPPPTLTPASQTNAGSTRPKSHTLPPFGTPSSNVSIPAIYSRPMILRPSLNKPSPLTSVSVPVPSSMAEPNWGMPSPKTGVFGSAATTSCAPATSAQSSFFTQSFVSREELCTRHIRAQCKSPACHALPRSMRSTIGAGLDTRALSSLSKETLSSSTPHMLVVLSNFLRLSALVAAELADEALSSPSSPTASSSTPAFTPQREWYALLCGILTRAVLEGYAMHGWKGNKPAEVLFGFGGGRAAPSSGAEEDWEEGEFEPDEFPTLVRAYKMLFVDANAEEHKEFRNELKRRKDEFLRPSEPMSISAHLQAINERYPPEKLDRAMIKFCERVASWRGEPELAVTSSRGAIILPGRGSPASSSISSLHPTTTNPPTTVTGSPRAGKQKAKSQQNEVYRYFSSPSSSSSGGTGSRSLPGSPTPSASSPRPSYTRAPPTPPKGASPSPSKRQRSVSAGAEGVAYKRQERVVV